MNANHVVSTDRLIDSLWGQELPQTARATLQTYLSRLRILLGVDMIEGRPPGYVLHVDAGDVDAFRFERLLHAARLETALPARAAALAKALELWRGPALDELAGEPSLSGQIARLEELRLQATEEKIEAELALGQHTQAVADLEVLTWAHPLRERLWGQLMLALYRSDRQAQALGVFERARRRLSEDLGVDPSRELQLLRRRTCSRVLHWS